MDRKFKEFHFSCQDDIEGLHPNIAKYLAKYTTNRLVDFKELITAVDKADYEQMRDYCHKILGTARCYHLFRLEEITNELHRLVQKTQLDEIKSLLSTNEDYLQELRRQFPLDSDS